MSGQNEHPSNAKTIAFVFTICFVCALILSILASSLRQPQKEAIELFKSKQLLIAAKILNYDGQFIIQDENKNFVPADYNAETGKLSVAKGSGTYASSDQILTVFKDRILPRLTDSKGNLYTFEELDINYLHYLDAYEKEGYAFQKYKLLFLVQPNLSFSELKERKPFPAYAYVLPISGQGLWDAINGYICVEQNANTVLGTTWYDQNETPGLGGNIALPDWQKQFYGKVIFQKNAEGQTDFSRAPIGITVVKTTVKDELGDSPKAKSSVDGISGATITANGVSEAYRTSLEEYRDFLIRAHQASSKQPQAKGKSPKNPSFSIAELVSQVEKMSQEHPVTAGAQ